MFHRPATLKPRDGNVCKISLEGFIRGRATEGRDIFDSASLGARFTSRAVPSRAAGEGVRCWRKKPTGAPHGCSSNHKCWWQCGVCVRRWSTERLRERCQDTEGRVGDLALGIQRAELNGSGDLIKQARRSGQTRAIARVELTRWIRDNGSEQASEPYLASRIYRT